MFEILSVAFMVVIFGLYLITDHEIRQLKKEVGELKKEGE